MRMFPVSGSSNIVAIGYDAAARELRVEFKSAPGSDQRTYSYADVPADVAGVLFGSTSIGSTFAQVVKPRFKAQLLEASPTSTSIAP